MKFGILIAALVAAGGLCGCRAIDREAPEKPAEAAAAAIPADAREIKVGDTLLKAIQENNYKLFASVLRGELAGEMTEKDFDTSRETITKQFGELKEFKFLTALKTPTVKNLIWQVTFERVGTQEQEIEQDLLFRLVTGTVDNQVEVLSFGFL